MDATHTLLFVIAIQLSLACVGWWLAGTVLGLSLRDVTKSLDAPLPFAKLERFARLKLKH